ncbi:hypothetical protein XNW1_4900015 [Xenorhabdus nematophila str. Websteri]|nr:hypothetical protein XNW1_1470015 [Xenorhabdus nematophila str. Websteri]CEF33715.1 hypothetical protein XNW1_4900015 [Xenorhabdus nematophila str. Websteri]
MRADDNVQEGVTASPELILYCQAISLEDTRPSIRGWLRQSE